MMLRTLKMLVMAALIVSVADSVLSQDGMPPALVKVSTVSVQSLAPVTMVPGTVASRHDARLAMEVTGRLTEVADVGTRVTQGEPLARVEDTRLQLRHDELEAEVARVKARLSYLESEEKRFASLAESNLAATTQLELTRSDRDVAANELRVAESRLAQNNDQLDRTTLRAPFDGVVVERLMTRGERVSEGDLVLRLVDQGQLEVVARAPLDYYPYVREGLRLEVRTQRMTTHANVRTVVALGSESVHQFELRLDLEDQNLPVGQTLRVAVPMDEIREVLAVPRDALVLRPEGVTVFIVDANGMAQQVSVSTGVGAGEHIEVHGALSAGDQVVIRGNERLQPGQPVSINES